MTEKSWQSTLQKLKPCDSAMRFCKKFDDTPAGFAGAWEKCEHGDWMGWLCMKVINQVGIMPPDMFRMVMNYEEGRRRGVKEEELSKCSDGWKIVYNGLMGV